MLRMSVCNVDPKDVENGLQVQRAQAAMAALPAKARLEGLVWYQVRDHFRKLASIKGVEELPILPPQCSWEAWTAWMQLFSCRESQMQTALRRCRATSRSSARSFTLSGERGNPPDSLMGQAMVCASLQSTASICTQASMLPMLMGVWGCVQVQADRLLLPRGANCSGELSFAGSCVQRLHSLTVLTMQVGVQRQHMCTTLAYHPHCT